MTLVHIDAYRLRSAEDLDAIGWQELMDRRDAIIALEWPSRVSSALPADRIKVQIEHSGDTSRVLTVTIPPAKADRLQHLDMDRQPRPTDPQVVACRSCGRSFDRSANTFPFCSERCRLADLGQWFREGYRTSRALERDEELNE
jgi:endogenous inhibitor of DNA gyrase (YacG/DUF329 family)